MGIGFPMPDEEEFTDGIDSFQVLRDNWVNLSSEMKEKLAFIWDGITTEMQDAMARLGQILKSGLENLTVTFAEGIGNLLTGDENIKGFGNNILVAIGGFLKMMGSALIVYGGLQKAFMDWKLDPFIKIALGIATIIAGQALMNIGSKGPDMGGVQGLATGGVVTSGGIFEVGEKGSEMVTLPRGSAVTPHGGGMMQELYAKISGEDIYLSNKRYGSKLGKVT